MPRETRKKYCEMIDNTMETLDSALLIVIKRINDLLYQSQSNFVSELKLIRDPYEWAEVERKVRLCGSLREHTPEMNSLRSKFEDKITGIDLNAIRRFINSVFLDEEKLGDYIASKFEELASMAEEATSQNGFERAVNAVIKARSALRDEQRKLIRKQIEFYDLLSP